MQKVSNALRGSPRKETLDKMSKITLDGQEYEVSGELPAVGGSKILVVNPIKPEPKRWEVEMTMIDETDNYAGFELNVYGITEPQAEAIKASLETLMEYIFAPTGIKGGLLVAHKQADKARKALGKE